MDITQDEMVLLCRRALLNESGDNSGLDILSDEALRSALNIAQKVFIPEFDKMEPGAPFEIYFSLTRDENGIPYKSFVLVYDGKSIMADARNIKGAEFTFKSKFFRRPDDEEVDKPAVPLTNEAFESYCEDLINEITNPAGVTQALKDREKLEQLRLDGKLSVPQPKSSRVSVKKGGERVSLKNASLSPAPGNEGDIQLYIADLLEKEGIGEEHSFNLARQLMPLREIISKYGKHIIDNHLTLLQLYVIAKSSSEYLNQRGRLSWIIQGWKPSDKIVEHYNKFLTRIKEKASGQGNIGNKSNFYSTGSGFIINNYKIHEQTDKKIYAGRTIPKQMETRLLPNKKQTVSAALISLNSLSAGKTDKLERLLEFTVGEQLALVTISKAGQSLKGISPETIDYLQAIFPQSDKELRLRNLKTAFANLSSNIADLLETNPFASSFIIALDVDSNILYAANSAEELEEGDRFICDLPVAYSSTPVIEQTAGVKSIQTFNEFAKLMLRRGRFAILMKFGLIDKELMQDQQFKRSNDKEARSWRAEHGVSLKEIKKIQSDSAYNKDAGLGGVSDDVMQKAMEVYEANTPSSKSDADVYAGIYSMMEELTPLVGRIKVYDAIKQIAQSGQPIVKVDLLVNRAGSAKGGRHYSEESEETTAQLIVKGDENQVYVDASALAESNANAVINAENGALSGRRSFQQAYGSKYSSYQAETDDENHSRAIDKYKYAFTVDFDNLVCDSNFFVQSSQLNWKIEGKSYNYESFGQALLDCLPDTYELIEGGDYSFMVIRKPDINGFEVYTSEHYGVSDGAYGGLGKWDKKHIITSIGGGETPLLSVEEFKKVFDYRATDVPSYEGSSSFDEVNASVPHPNYW